MGTFKLTLKGDGISVDKEVNHATALAIMNAVMTQESAQSGTGPTLALEPPKQPSVTPTPAANDKPTSLREFVNEIHPKTNAELIATIGQYLSIHRNSEKFTREDIKGSFSAAGEALPKNFTRDFQTSMDKGWIGEFPDDRNKFFITRTGEVAIEGKFSRPDK